MIKSGTIKINKTDNFDDVYIEKQLASQFLNIIRWAVIDVSDSEITVSVSYKLD